MTVSDSEYEFSRIVLITIFHEIDDFSLIFFELGEHVLFDLKILNVWVVRGRFLELLDGKLEIGDILSFHVFKNVKEMTESQGI